MSSTPKAPSPRALPQSVGDGVRTAVRLLRLAADWTLLLLFDALVVRFALQLPHPPKWDTWRLTIAVRELTDVVVGWTAETLGYAWPSPTLSFLPLGLALVVWMARGLLTHRLELLRRAIRRPEKDDGPRLEDAERAWLTRAAGMKMAEHTTLAPPSAPPSPEKG